LGARKEEPHVNHLGDAARTEATVNTNASTEYFSRQTETFDRQIQASAGQASAS
jgi:hypothetical protein